MTIENIMTEQEDAFYTRLFIISHFCKFEVEVNHDDIDNSSIIVIQKFDTPTPEQDLGDVLFNQMRLGAGDSFNFIDDVYPYMFELNKKFNKTSHQM